MRLLAITVLFHPDQDAFLNIGRYLSDVDCLIIWDNTPSKDRQYDIISSLQNIYQEKDIAKIQIMGTGRNEGLSFAYNRAVKYAQDNGYTHLMTMDQDSQWEDFKKFKTFAEKYWQKNGLAILGPEIQIGTTVKSNVNHLPIKKNVRTVINSGAIIPIQIFEKIGLYSERFFVYAVDNEICYRCNRANIQVAYILYSGYLIQKFGNPSKFIFRKKEYECKNYSPASLFGIVRNMTLLSRVYPEESLDIIQYVKDICIKHWIKVIIIGEKKKFSKIIAILLGYIIGLTTHKSTDSKYSKA